MGKLEIIKHPRTGFSFLSAILVVLVFVLVHLPADHSTRAGTFDNSTYLGAYNAYQDIEANLNAQPNWTGSVANCNAGTISQAFNNSTLAVINDARGLAGLQPVSFDPTLSSYAQQASLMMAANGSLNHNPPSTWKCYTSQGYAGASTSNLAGESGPRSILDYLGDYGDLGHRRWVLYPPTATMGNGAAGFVDGALTVIGGATQNTPPPSYVGWPSAGFFPYQLIGGDWSLSASDASTDMSATTVQVVKNGASLPVTVSHLANGYGDPTVSWDFDPGYTYGQANFGKQSYTVTVSNMKKNGSVLAPYTYTVILMDGNAEPVDYGWDYVGATISGNSWNVQGNHKYTVTLTAENTGTQSWSNTNFPVRIATFDPTNHLSPLYDSSWYSPTEPATLNEPVVLPGDDGTFTFAVNIPNQSGLYSEHFNLEAEGAAWMPDIGFTLQFNVSPLVYAWQMVSESSTNGFELQPGQTSTFTLVAKNTGDVTWNNSANPVRLATWAPSYRTSAFDDGSWVSPYRPANLQQSSVAPGQNGTFVFNVRAPSTPGFYVERFNLVMEGVAWFTDPWVEFDVNVGNFYTWKMVSESSDQSFTLHTGQTANFTLTALNTGNVTWTNNPNTPVRLATWAPSYRTSVFNPNDGSWINPYRAAVVTQSSVAPGQTSTFTFKVKAPNRPGFYVERFNLVMENVAWFVDPWVEFDINVTN